MASIDTIRDDVFMGVTEAMAITGATMEERQSETLLVISLAEEGHTAVLGGELSETALITLRDMLDELLENVSEPTGVLQATR